MVQFLVLLVISVTMLSCSIESKLSDSTDYVMELKEPMTITYSAHNKTTVKWEIKDMFGEKADLTNVKLENLFITALIYKNENCSGDPFESKTLRSFSDNIDLPTLDNQVIYSFKVNFVFGGVSTFTECSAPVVVDRDPPTTAPPQYPPGNTWTGDTNFDARINPATDVGLAGLAPESYELTLYRGQNCAGDILQVVTTHDTEFRFSGLLHGFYYSLKSIAIDKAGNRSQSTCSPNLEIDLFVPVVSANDPSSFSGYTRTPNLPINITNTTGGTQFCVTHDAGFIPTSALDACPGGSWSPTPPNIINLTNGEGNYTLNVWMADNAGTLLTNKAGTTQVIYDNTSPNIFSITGIGGNLDLNYDAWLNTTQTPTVTWQASTSTDTKEYHLTLLDASGLTTVCGPVTINHPDNQIRLDGCSLTDGVSYKVALEAMDFAGNIQAASAIFDFTVDLTPPQSFTIAGITGNDEVNVDAWLKSLVPQINYVDADGEDLYLIRVLDASDGLICSQEQQNANILLHNYFATGTCSGLSHGATYKAEVIAKDFAGNQTPADNSPFLFVVDRVLPTASFTLTPPAIIQSPIADFEFIYNDDLSGVDKIECQLNTNPWASCSSPNQLTGLAEDNYTYKVRVTDHAGNDIKLLTPG